MTMRAPWLLRVCWDPVEALDLKDARGHPDHGKIMGLVFFVTVVVLKAAGISFTGEELFLLSVGIYGGRMMLAYLKLRPGPPSITETTRTTTAPTPPSPSITTTHTTTTQPPALPDGGGGRGPPP